MAGEKRPYTTDYGPTKGHVSTPRRAIRAVVNRLEATNGRHAVIEQPSGPAIDVWWNGYFGVTVKMRRK